MWLVKGGRWGDLRGGGGDFAREVGGKGGNKGRRHRASQNHARCHARFPNWGNCRSSLVLSKMSFQAQLMIPLSAFLPPPIPNIFVQF